MKPVPRGGFAVGLVAGLLIGLAVALAVALYVTKAPIPFVNKLPQRTAEQDAAEAERNKHWDPNAPLGGKNAAPRAAAPASGAQAALPGSATAPAVATAATPATTPAPAAGPAAPPQAAATPAATSAATSAATTPAPARSPASAAAAARDPAAILAGQGGGAAPAAKPAMFFVQAGAYGSPDDAEAQRARLAMSGFTAKVMAREQTGKTVYRVRLGPFDERDAADDLREKLGAAGVESTLVRVER
ncbi:SPOR domain-containing protein [Aquabacterium sp. OR-4]|nr:SPOR domain-containing protein [Aquabacterium sp. OR-4]MDT7833972.1 SPOR domain-containing protein [Aquabacterium sp. OR-4]